MFRIKGPGTHVCPEDNDGMSISFLHHLKIRQYQKHVIAHNRVIEMKEGEKRLKYQDLSK